MDTFLYVHSEHSKITGRPALVRFVAASRTRVGPTFCHTTALPLPPHLPVCALARLGATFRCHLPLPRSLCPLSLLSPPSGRTSSLSSIEVARVCPSVLPGSSLACAGVCPPWPPLSPVVHLFSPLHSAPFGFPARPPPAQTPPPRTPPPLPLYCFAPPSLPLFLMSAIVTRRRTSAVALKPAAEVIDLDSGSSDDDVPLLNMRHAGRNLTPAVPPPPPAATAAAPGGTGTAVAAGDSDNDLVVVSPHAVAPAAHPPASDVAVVSPRAAPPPASVALDDGLELMATTQNIHVYPHGRADCPAHRFIPAVTAAAVTANRATCEKCFCYVCDMTAADCGDWAVHCMAHAGSQAWQAVRSRKKRRLALQITAELFIPGCAAGRATPAGHGRGAASRGGRAPASGGMAAAATSALTRGAPAAPATAYTVSSAAAAAAALQAWASSAGAGGSHRGLPAVPPPRRRVSSTGSAAGHAVAPLAAAPPPRLWATLEAPGLAASGLAAPPRRRVATGAAAGSAAALATVPPPRRRATLEVPGHAASAGRGATAPRLRRIARPASSRMGSSALAGRRTISKRGKRTTGRDS